MRAWREPFTFVRKSGHRKVVLAVSEVLVFTSEEFGKVRTLTQNNEILFVAADVCAALGLANSRKAVSRLDDDEKGVTSSDTLGGKQQMNVVTEAGLYNLVLASRKPEAKGFKRWITHDVIPQIRKTGQYRTKGKQPLSEEVQQKRAEAMLLNARTRQSKAWMAISDKTTVPEYKRICQQKAAEALAGKPVLPLEEVKERTYSAADIGKVYGVSAMKIGQLANKHNLKTPQYGKYFYSKSEHSCKEVETFRYYQSAISRFDELLKGGTE